MKDDEMQRLKWAIDILHRRRHNGWAWALKAIMLDGSFAAHAMKVSFYDGFPQMTPATDYPPFEAIAIAEKYDRESNLNPA